MESKSSMIIGVVGKGKNNYLSLIKKAIEIMEFSDDIKIDLEDFSSNKDFSNIIEILNTKEE